MSASTAVLTSERVQEVFTDSLFRDGEDTSEHIAVKGIMNNVGFHPERLKSHRQEIIDMLTELPEEFQKSGGGGSTFLNACLDRHGNQWSGMHLIMEQLVLLGIAIERAEFVLPRELWQSLPGGMPYFVIMDDLDQSSDSPDSGGQVDKSAQEHLDWCIKRALEYYDKNDEVNAIGSFVSDVRKHEGTAHILDPGMITLAILQDGAKRGRKAFEEAMSGFVI